MKRPLLSICIATYNRADYIGETMESILPQMTEEVEIVVVDGASTDDTDTVVRSYADSSKQIRYIRLPSKGGVDQDYCKAVEYARGEMCWLFPDDDLLMPGAIDTVLCGIRQGYSLVVVNARVMNKDLSRILEGRCLLIDKNEIYDVSELEQLFQCVIPYMSFIGCVVLNRALWLQREKECYFNTEFIHIGVIFQAMLPAPALVIAEPYITIRYGNSQWTPRAFEIWMFKWPGLFSSLKNISEKVREEKRLIEPWRRLRSIIFFRAKGAYSLKEYRKWFASKKLSVWWKAGALFTAVVPSHFVNLVVLSCYRLVRKEAVTAIYDLENCKLNIFNRL